MKIHQNIGENKIAPPFKRKCWKENIQSFWWKSSQKRKRPTSNATEKPNHLSNPFIIIPNPLNPNPPQPRRVSPSQSVVTQEWSIPILTAEDQQGLATPYLKHPGMAVSHQASWLGGRSNVKIPPLPLQKKKSGQQPKKHELIEKCGKMQKHQEIPMYQSLFTNVKRQEKKHPTLEEWRHGQVYLWDIETGSMSRHGKPKRVIQSKQPNLNYQLYNYSDGLEIETKIPLK